MLRGIYQRILLSNMKQYQAALAHFRKADPVMAVLLEAALQHEQSLPALAARLPDTYFQELVESIVGQQLSVKAAATIWKRFEALVGKVTPANILKHSPEEFRSVGMSNAKARYVLGLALDVVDKRIDLTDLHKLENEVVIERLVLVKGIGRWSAEMFLMFTLARPDVFSSGDLGLVRAVELAYNKPGISKDELDRLAQIWSPHRTIAALALWHSRDNSPKSG